MIFFGKKPLENVLPTYQERIARAESRIISLEAEVLDIATAVSTLRNKVLRKIQFKKDLPGDDDTQSLNNPVLLPEPNGQFQRHR